MATIINSNKTVGSPHKSLLPTPPPSPPHDILTQDEIRDKRLIDFTNRPNHILLRPSMDTSKDLDNPEAEDGFRFHARRFLQWKECEVFAETECLAADHDWVQFCRKWFATYGRLPHKEMDTMIAKMAWQRKSFDLDLDLYLNLFERVRVMFDSSNVDLDRELRNDPWFWNDYNIVAWVQTGGPMEGAKADVRKVTSASLREYMGANTATTDASAEFWRDEHYKYGTDRRMSTEDAEQKRELGEDAEHKGKRDEDAKEKRKQEDIQTDDGLKNHGRKHRRLLSYTPESSVTLE
ncbi:hypothetical protein EJ06DRAFT_126660 [Trichodelitschia bisporula]|uniref:Uncharacterized protein n=1 Tax=Trichodelitschia bisporula TaxID=703511 RepID=A0A6G1HQ65_9PEZI|nr:hypothetical protein EJ06DRAFT_126660 [Trichodelitschia bisporula]